ncbi:hypothetical protein PHMEG_00023180 [Phytophthora megakarya]|uniref:SWIM-type domain-containing protein n=1 Tax=Phytophthora megakarya TaxID=4795 RepID=A0A225VIB3_9STRA|nr:hypothetical protein PHMEG_00023180 [Phytophthora megakarya]
MLPTHTRSTDSLDGKAIRDFLKSHGYEVHNSAISRMKIDIDDRLRGDVVESYQKLQAAKPLNGFSLYFQKLSELTSEKRQLAANWAQKHPDSNLVPIRRAQLRDRTTAASMCQFVPLMEGAYSVQHLGPQTEDGHIHTWRLVDLPGQECTCGNWKDQAFPCIHAICAAIQDGCRLEHLYDSVKMSIKHFIATYTFRFRPWPKDVTLDTDTTLLVPVLQIEDERLGKRGLKPGPKPKHKRRRAKNAL